MARLLAKLGSTAYRRWPFFIAAWLMLAVVVGGLAGTVAKPFTDEFSIPGIPSEKAAQIQKELFPASGDAFDDASVNVVLVAPGGHTLDDQTYGPVVADLVDDIRALPQMADDAAANPSLGNPVELADAQRSAYVDRAKAADGDVAAAKADAAAVSPSAEGGRVGLMTFSWDVKTPADVEQASIDQLDEALDAARDAGLTAEVNGAGSKTQPEMGMTSELIGLAVALVVLVLTFGSLVSAGMPLVTAVMGVGIGLSGVTAMTALMDLNSSTTMLASMIGLAVGIDYALFILARYRTELHHTDDREHAIGIAVGTAGSAVVFAGLTVLIALSALAVVNIPFLTAMGLAAAATVFVAVLVALTLLPAVLGMLKSKAFGGRVRRYQPRRDESGQILNNGVRWARTVGRYPVAFAAVVVIGLGALAVPLKDLHLAFPTDSTAAPATTQRQASDLISEHFGPGREGPLLAVVDATDVAEGGRDRAFDDVTGWINGLPDVANAQVVATNATYDADGNQTAAATGAMIQVTPSSGPDETATQDLLLALRDGQAGIESDTGTTIGITGLTAITTDISDRLSSALPIYLAIVIGLAFLLLMLVFRSILVPLTATLGFLLSVLATLGATVAVFQEGMFGLFEPQPIVSFMPIFLIGLVFGLAMDYQVFLVTRMREAHVHGMSTREAVVDGFRNSARVVTAAATIMIAVFAAFMLQSEPIVQSMGFALASAIVFDAFIVRLVLIPATLYLLGEKAWWLPKWLDRVLPNVDVEGESLERHPASAGPTGDLDDDLDQDRELAGV
jgi:RND superfamily putative drug exporter